MPFQSDAQRKFMYSQKPEMAKKFAKETPKGVNLPERAAPAPTPERKVNAMKAMVANPSMSMAKKPMNAAAKPMLAKKDNAQLA